MLSQGHRCAQWRKLLYKLIYYNRTHTNTQILHHHSETSAAHSYSHRCMRCSSTLLISVLLLLNCLQLVIIVITISHRSSPFPLHNLQQAGDDDTAALTQSLQAQLQQAHTEIQQLQDNLSTVQLLAAKGFASTDAYQLCTFTLPNDTDSEAYTQSPSVHGWSRQYGPVLLPNDLSHPDRATTPAASSAIYSPILSYDYCHSPPPPLPYCKETPDNEQYYQLTFFNRPGAGKRVTPREGRPKHTDCIQLPPLNYQFPNKSSPFPCAEHLVNQCIHLPNLRVQHLQDLQLFNPGYAKNLYHFYASFYDTEQEHIVRLVAQYIPFGLHIRNMLDIGAGGASIALHLYHLYGIQTINTVFADWPYCEYIAERGGLCIYLDAMDPMPFAKFAFDIVHSSWVFHACTPQQLIQTMLEHHRITRPGGYVWLMGGWSREQVAAMEQLFLQQLGYRLVYENRLIPPDHDTHTFDGTPFQIDWHVILQRPTHAYCGNYTRHTEIGKATGVSTGMSGKV